MTVYPKGKEKGTSTNRNYMCSLKVISYGIDFSERDTYIAVFKCGQKTA